MKGVILFLYILMSIIYLFFGSGRMWGGFHHINQYLIIGCLCFWSTKPEKYSKIEKLLLYYIIFFEFSISSFTGACISAPTGWVNNGSIIFTSLMSLILVGVLSYGYYKYKNELGEY